MWQSKQQIYVCKGRNQSHSGLIFLFLGEDVSEAKDGSVIRRIIKNGEKYRTPSEGATVKGLSCQFWRGCRCDDMVVGFTTTFVIGAYHHKGCEFESHSGEVYSIQQYVIKLTCSGSMVSPNTPVSSIWPPRCSWNIVESGIKHHNTNPYQSWSLSLYYYDRKMLNHNLFLRFVLHICITRMIFYQLVNWHQLFKQHY